MTMTLSRLHLDWLDEIRHQPRGAGAFHRRIETILRDAAVARRVSCRLEKSGNKVVRIADQADR